MTSTSDRQKNKELKERNTKIFGQISDLLASDEEDKFLNGTKRITKFISAKEAYYAQALPFVS